jgi:hypothetical protein
MALREIPCMGATRPHSYHMRKTELVSVTARVPAEDIAGIPRGGLSAFIRDAIAEKRGRNVALELCVCAAGRALYSLSRGICRHSQRVCTPKDRARLEGGLVGVGCRMLLRTIRR